MISRKLACILTHIVNRLVIFPAKHFFKTRHLPRMWQSRDSAALGAPTSPSAARQSPHTAANGGKPRPKYWGQSYIFPAKHFFKTRHLPCMWQSRDSAALGAPTSSSAARQGPHSAADGGNRTQNIGDSLIFSPQNTFSRRAACRACGRVATPPRWEHRRPRRLRGKVRTLPRAAGNSTQDIGNSLVFLAQNTF